MKFADFAVLSMGVMLNALAQLGLKAATRASGPMHFGEPKVGQQMMQVLAVPSLWWALLAYGLSVGVWVIALSRVPVGQAYPLLSMGYIVNIGLAWWLIGEVPNAQRMLGVGVIVAGVVLVARS
jgi:drug/metabolite transporter (DMT)-like permease